MQVEKKINEFYEINLKTTPLKARHPRINSNKCLIRSFNPTIRLWDRGAHHLFSFLLLGLVILALWYEVLDSQGAKFCSLIVTSHQDICKKFQLC